MEFTNTEFTTKQIEALLRQEAYAPVERLNKKTLTEEQRQESLEVERIHFGEAIITLFDNLILDCGTLPTQKHYCERGLQILEDWFREHKHEIKFTSTVVKTCNLKLARTYMSRLVELHLYCILKEYLPWMTIRQVHLQDMVMGVDFILEDDVKRYYVHVTSNTPMAQKMLKQKEGRGGYLLKTPLGTQYIRYSRDFTGDLSLKYEPYIETDTTQIINGFPLFKPDFVVWRLKLAKQSESIGEVLTSTCSKLAHFEDWLNTYLKAKRQVV